MSQYVRNCLLILLPLALLLCLGCASPPPPGNVVDDLGRTINISQIPQRIVSLAPSNTEILFALGLGDRVVGVTDYCDYPPEALEKEKIGGPRTPNIEKIVALQPDLVLAAGINPIDVVNTLEGLELIVFGIESTDLDDLLNDIRTVGMITDKETEAEALTDDMQSRIDAVTEKTEGLSWEEKPKVFHICWHGPIWTSGQGTFVHDLIEKAGGVNIFDDRKGWKAVTLEAVIIRDPEVIIVTAMGGIASETWDWVNTDSRLENVSARKNGRIYFVESNWVERAGPRIVLGLEKFAEFIHPELFKESQ